MSSSTRLVERAAVDLALAGGQTNGQLTMKPPVAPWKTVGAGLLVLRSRAPGRRRPRRPTLPMISAAASPAGRRGRA